MPWYRHAASLRLWRDLSASPPVGLGGTMTYKTLRYLRDDLRWTQVELARHLSVPPDTYRCWEGGRRPIPPEVVTQLWLLSSRERDDQLVSLSTLAEVLGIHVRTLRTAARDGRLAVTYGSRTYFGRAVPMATAATGRAFQHLFYRKTTRWTARPPRPEPLPKIPDNYDLHLVGLRSRFGMTQTGLARAIGASGKAVIYQRERRRPKPSAALWLRVEQLKATGPAIR